MPKYFTVEKSTREKSTLSEPSTSAAKRRKKDEERYYVVEDAFFESDYVSSLSDIKSKLENEKNIPDGFLKHMTDSRIVFVQLDVSDSKPKLLRSMVVEKNLHFQIYNGDNKVKEDSYKHIVDSHALKTFSQLLNLLAFMKSLKIDHVMDDSLYEALKCLKVRFVMHSG